MTAHKNGPIMETEVAVVGGGLLGSAVALGLARRGLDVTVFDQGNEHNRASVGNFGLVWFQGKGAGIPRYSAWTLRSARKYADFCAELEEETGYQTHLRQNGGLVVSLSDKEFKTRAAHLDRMRTESIIGDYPCEMIDRIRLEKLIPKLRLGDSVAGASFSPQDGHVNPLFLLSAMQRAYGQAGGRFQPGCRVDGLDQTGTGYALRTNLGQIRCQRILFAGGLGSRDLGALVGLDLPIRPQKGQIMASQRVEPLLDYPMTNIRQTGEGSFLLGLSTEENPLDLHNDPGVLKNIAGRLVDLFPQLGNLRVVHSWAAWRVLTPDVAPIYQESASHPGVFAMASHSGVTLAPMHADEIAAWVAGQETDPLIKAFSLERFDVPTTA